jgi:hypothetical protein
MVTMEEMVRPSVWAAGRAGMKLDWYQAAAVDDTRQYQAWCWSRQTGKSTAAAIRSAWQVMTRPDQLVLLFSNSLRQSMELFRKVVRVYGGTEEGEPRRTNDNLYDMTLDNGSRVLSLPGHDESILGYSPNLVIIDEAAVVSDKFFRAVNPMLARSHGSLIVASTPRGKRGFFWNDIMKEPGDQWAVTMVRAEESPHIERQFLEQQLRLLGEDWFEQEYHCKFLETTGTLFTDDMINAMFTDDGRVVETKGYEMDLDDEGRGWQEVFEMGQWNGAN